MIQDTLPGFPAPGRASVRIVNLSNLGAAISVSVLAESTQASSSGGASAGNGAAAASGASTGGNESTGANGAAGNGASSGNGGTTGAAAAQSAGASTGTSGTDLANGLAALSSGDYVNVPGGVYTLAVTSSGIAGEPSSNAGTSAGTTTSTGSAMAASSSTMRVTHALLGHGVVYTVFVAPSGNASLVLISADASVARAR